MKHGVKPTRDQRKLIKRCGLDTHEWLVIKDTSTEMVLLHRHYEHVIRVIAKGELI